MAKVKVAASDVQSGDRLDIVSGQPTVIKVSPLGNGMVDIVTEGKTYLFTRSTVIRVTRTATVRQVPTEETPAKPAIIVLTGEQITALASSARLIAYRVAARSDGKMQLTHAFRATVKGFNADYGHSCRTWADVRAVFLAAGIKL
jgi:hypothetical protein